MANFKGALYRYAKNWGQGFFQNPNRLYDAICNFSPTLKPYGNVMRQLSEWRILAELDAASANGGARLDSALTKALRAMEDDLLLDAKRADEILDALAALAALYGGNRVRTRQAPSAKIVRHGDCGRNMRYTLDTDGVLTISGRGSMWDFHKRRDDYNTPWWSKRESISCVKIQHGVTSIKNHAFAHCTGLARVSVPAKAKIHPDAFPHTAVTFR